MVSRRRQFLLKIYPILFAFLRRILRRPPSSLLCIQEQVNYLHSLTHFTFSNLLQHHVSKLFKCSEESGQEKLIIHIFIQYLSTLRRWIKPSAFTKSVRRISTFMTEILEACCPRSHRLRSIKLYTIVAVPPAPVRVPNQWPLAPSVTSVASVNNGKGDNWMRNMLFKSIKVELDEETLIRGRSKFFKDCCALEQLS